MMQIVYQLISGGDDSFTDLAACVPWAGGGHDEDGRVFFFFFFLRTVRRSTARRSLSVQSSRQVESHKPRSSARLISRKCLAVARSRFDRPVLLFKAPRSYSPCRVVQLMIEPHVSRTAAVSRRCALRRGCSQSEGCVLLVCSVSERTHR